MPKNPKKVADAQNAQDIQSKKDKLQKALINLLLFLIITCWYCLGQRKIYLKTEELTSTPPFSRSAFDTTQRQNNNYPARVDDDVSLKQQQQQLLTQAQQQSPPSFWIEEEEIENNCNSIDIDLTKVEKNHWAYRAINEALYDGKSSIEIDSGELIDFVRTTKATFGIHATDIGESIRHFFMYLSFKNNNI